MPVSPPALLTEHPPPPCPRQDLWRKEWRGAVHKEAVERAYCTPPAAPLQAVLTAGRGGQLK